MTKGVAVRNTAWTWRWSLVPAGWLLIGGCTDLKSREEPAKETRGPVKATASETEQLPVDPTIVRVAAYYDPFNPWMWDESRSRVVGIVVSRLYLGGGRNGLGVFGDGVIRPRVFLLDNDKTNPKPPQLVKEWSFDVQQAVPFRSTKRTAQGWGYGLPLAFDEGTNLAGKEIRIIVAFERRDGMVLQSGKKDFRVPGTPARPAMAPSVPR